MAQVDRDSTMPLFVVDGKGVAKLPHINDEDISYVSVTEKMSYIYNRIERMCLEILLTSVTMPITLKNIFVGNNISYSNIVKTSAGIHSRNASPTAFMSPATMPVSCSQTTPIPSVSTPSSCPHSWIMWCDISTCSWW